MQVNISPLSKNACAPEPSTAAWEPGYRVQWRCATNEFALADWACDGRATDGANEELPEHFELYVQRSGWHRRVANGERYVVDALHQGLWPGGRPYTLSENTGRAQAATLMFLERGALETLLADVAGARAMHWQTLMHAPVIADSAATSLHLAQLLTAPREDALRMQETALRFVRTFLRNALRAETKPNAARTTERHLAERARTFICTNYRAPISLHDVATAAGVSNSRLSVVFSRVYGKSVWRHVQDLRLQAALYAMPDYANDLTRLAMDFGFNSHSHFSQAFRARFGSAPSRASAAHPQI